MKKIFYYTDVLPLLAKNETAIKKIERNLEIFRNVSDSIRLVWHPWSKTCEYLQLNRSDVEADFLKVVERYRQEGWGEFDEADNYQAVKEVLFGCDAYYGDVSDLAYEAQLAKIPVMLQNFDV